MTEPFSEDLEQELQNGFADLLRNASPNSPSSILPKSEPEHPPRSDAQLYEEQANSTNEATTPVGSLLESVKSAVASNDPDRALQPLTAIFSKMMDLVPTSSFHHVPTAIIPNYSLSAGETRPPFYDAKQSSATGLQEISDFAGRAFRMLNAVQDRIQNPTVSQPRTSPGAPSSSASTTASSTHLDRVASLMATVSETLGENWAPKEMSRMMRGNEPFLREAVRKAAQLLASTPETSSEYPLQQTTFGLALLHLYELTREDAQLDAAISATASALTIRPSGGVFPIYATMVTRNWAYSQRLLARRDASTDPLERALSLGRTTMRISFEYYPDADLAGRRLLSMELAECLLDHYRAVGQADDLDEALQLISTAFKDDELEDTTSRRVLAALYLERFMRRADVDDIDKALYHAIRFRELDADSSFSQPALIPSTPDPDAAPCLNLFAMSWAQRSTIVMDIDELDTAIKYARAAVRECSDRDPLYSILLSDLASLLYQHFTADQDPADLDECIQHLERAMETARPGAYVHFPPQAVLGLALARRGEHKSDLGEIDKGIRHLTIARRAFAGGSHLESRIGRDMATALFCRFEQTKSQEDLDDAVRYATSALERAPQDDQSRGALSLQLGRMLALRYTLLRTDADLERAIDTLRTVATGHMQPSIRLQAAMEWAKAASSRGPALALDALKVALDILPLVAWSGSRMVVQYRALASLSADVGPWAAACAIACGQLEDATTYLERGRNVLWNQSLKLQPGARKHRASAGGGTSTTEFDSLSSYLSNDPYKSDFPNISDEHKEKIKSTNPQMYDILEGLLSLHSNLVQKMEQHPAHRPGNFERTEMFKSMFTDVYQDAARHGAANRWMALRATTDQLKDDAIVPCSLQQDSDLAALLSMGRVVFVNEHTSRCDALILRRSPEGSVDVCHVPLPDLSAEDTRGWAEAIQIGMYDLQEGEMTLRDFEDIILIPVLRGLWRAVASPVLSFLSLSATDDLPRIWWCPTGSLAFLPLHAAGPYEDNAKGVPDLVISSYTPTLQSLLRAYRAEHAPFSLLMIGQPETPNLSPLPYVLKEFAVLQHSCAQVAQAPKAMIGRDATLLAVSQALPSHSWLHFSCHAHQDPEYAFNSAFYMHNGALTLRALMQLDLARVQFAFLSACLTSAGDAQLPDECIHLAGALQFAGVRSAVATLWSVDDRKAAFVTEKVYGRLFREGRGEPDAREAAAALHDAVGAMRAAGRRMVFWVPFIHVGL